MLNINYLSQDVFIIMILLLFTIYYKRQSPSRPHHSQDWNNNKMAQIYIDPILLSKITKIKVSKMSRITVVRKTLLN